MCYYKSVKTTNKEIVKALEAVFPRQDEFQPIYMANGFAHPNMPVLSMEGGRSINLYNWGLIPHWVKDWTLAAKLRNQTLNARSEEVFEKPSFRDSIVKRRCIIPVTGFFEWKHIYAITMYPKGMEPPKDEVKTVIDKIPHYIHPRENPFFYLAGIYSHWTDPATKELHSTYSVLTGPANELMTSIHNSAKRQPLMIDKRNIDAWIDPSLPKSGIIELMQPCDDSSMAAYTVSQNIIGKNSIGNSEDVLTPVDYGTI